MIKCQGQKKIIQTKRYTRLKGTSGVARSLYLQLYGLVAGPLSSLYGIIISTRHAGPEMAKVL